MKQIFFACLLFFGSVSNANFNEVKNAIETMNGCYLVDYTYSEIESLKEDYKLDPRVYDSTSKFHVKELIKTVRTSENEIRLQHFMFATNDEGKIIFKLRHHGEIWQNNPEFSYVFWGEGRYEPTKYAASWVRIVTDLDDGLRYQCPGEWDLSGEYPKFSCSVFSPIPGRETRDMGRSDYNSMLRNSDVVLFGQGWFEKQSNLKMISEANTVTPLAKEIGKHWYVPVDESQCSEINEWAMQRQPFWNLLEQVWAEVLDGKGEIINSKKYTESKSRYQRISEIEEHHYLDVLNYSDDVEKMNHIRTDLREVISATIKSID